MHETIERKYQTRWMNDSEYILEKKKKLQNTGVPNTDLQANIIATEQVVKKIKSKLPCSCYLSMAGHWPVTVELLLFFPTFRVTKSIIISNM
jgi:hypothetical protein